MSRFSLLRALFRRPTSAPARVRRPRLDGLEERTTPFRDPAFFIGPGSVLTVIGGADSFNREFSEDIIIQQRNGEIGVFYRPFKTFPLQLVDIIDGDPDFTEIAELCRDAYRAVAPKTLVRRLDAST